MSGTLGIGPDGAVLQRDREQQVEQIGDPARVAAGALVVQMRRRSASTAAERGAAGTVDISSGVATTIPRRGAWRLSRPHNSDRPSWWRSRD